VRTLIVLAASLSLALTACSKKESAPAGGAKPTEAGKPGDKPAGKPAGDTYAAIDKLVAAAKTGDDFLNITMECGKLEIDAAMNGNDKLGQEPAHVEHCKVAPTKARAGLAIAQSTPDKMSEHCLSASMNLEELVTAGVNKAEFEPMLANVNKACGM
jgi:hypothetical protein